MAAAKSGRRQAQVPLGRTLHGPAPGLLGHGRIARQVAACGRAFGVRVLRWGSQAGRARAAAGETVAPSREAFFADARILSLHLRLVPETRGVVTVAERERMRPG